MNNAPEMSHKGLTLMSCIKSIIEPQPQLKNRKAGLHKTIDQKYK